MPAYAGIYTMAWVAPLAASVCPIAVTANNRSASGQAPQTSSFHTPCPSLLPGPTCPLLELPPEIILQILEHLSYPSLTNFRHTCHHALDLPPANSIALKRDLYTSKLAREETGDLVRRMRTSPPGDTDFRTNSDFCAYLYSLYREQHVTDVHSQTYATEFVCYTCCSRLPRQYFMETQIMGSRSYGHVDAHKRFCTPCGIKTGKWTAGTFFAGSCGGKIFCKCCGMIDFTDHVAKKDGRCTRCYADVNSHSKVGHGEVALTISSVQGSNDAKQLVQHQDQMRAQQSLEDTHIGVNGSTGVRACKCLRCWAVNHTYTEVNHHDGRNFGLCEKCSARADAARAKSQAADSTNSSPVSSAANPWPLRRDLNSISDLLSSTRNQDP